MGDAAEMPELQEDAPARLVHGVGHPAPAGRLGVAVDAGSAGIALALGRDLGCLGDDEAGARPLAVLLDIELVRRVLLVGPVAGHRRH